MSLFSIVAKEDFISVVMDSYEFGIDDKDRQEITTLREITPNQSFCIFKGQKRFEKETGEMAQKMVWDGWGLKETALAIQEMWQKNREQIDKMEAVIGGLSVDDIIQYHLLSTNNEVQSYYPKPGESLYYANKLSLEFNPLEELAKDLMMYGMSSLSQAKDAQFQLFEKFSGIQPGTSSTALSMVVEKTY